LPVAGGARFAEPARGEAGDTSGHAGIFDHIGEGAAFGESAETVKILTGEFEVVRVEGKERVGGSVFADPIEGAQPVAAGSEAGEFEVGG